MIIKPQVVLSENFRDYLYFESILVIHIDPYINILGFLGLTHTLFDKKDEYREKFELLTLKLKYKYS